MDPRILDYYNRELQHVRDMGGEFAKEFPKIAARLGLDGFECADPYVERLLEGFAFLAARVQLKIDAEFPRFTQHLLEMVYPHYLAPTPSMAVVQFQPSSSEGSLAGGFKLPRQTVLRSLLGKGEQTPCEYRTAHEVSLWPVELIEAQYFSYSRERSIIDVPELPGIQDGLRLRLRTTAGMNFDRLALDRLPLFLRGGEEISAQLYEQLLAHSIAMVVRPTDRPAPWREVIDKSNVRRMGFDDEQALMPYGPRSFHGYRLLQEYFAFPQRFAFVELGGMQPALRRCSATEVDIVILLDRSVSQLVNAVDASHFALHCTPAINLFPRRADRIHLKGGRTEYHVLPDRTRPLDFEVHSITEVVGHGAGADSEQRFLPFYASKEAQESKAFYTLRRAPRTLSAGQRRNGPRTHYVGNEVFVSLVDANEAPYRSDLRQLSLQVVCTNRDLPLLMSLGHGKTDFTLETGAPVEATRCLAGPTKPKPSHAEGEAAWRLINHLSLNYLSLADSDERSGAEALRELLSLYGQTSEEHVRKQIDGVRSVAARPITRRMPSPGPITFGRGLEVTLTCDEHEFEGTGVFMLGAVMEQFFAKYVSINSFTETVVRTLDRGEVIRWPLRTGLHPTL